MWEERIAAHTRNIYFARLAVRYRRFERGLGVATAVFSSVTVMAALGDIGVGPLWPAVAAGVSGILVAVLGFGESTLAMVNFSVAWGSLHHRLDDLWIEMEGGRVDHDSVRDALARIREHELYVDRDTTVEPQRTRLLLESLDQAEALAW